jgi:hypothetical protein
VWETPTADLVCQACGAGTVLRTAGWAPVLGVAAGTAGACVGATLAGLALVTGHGLAGAALAAPSLLGVTTAALAALRLAAPRWVDRRWPEVEAPAPPVRFPEPGAPRRCRCGEAAACVGTTYAYRERLFGTTWTYRCASCGRTIAVQGGWRLVSNAGVGAVVAGLGLAGVVWVLLDPPAHWKLVGPVGLAAFVTFVVAAVQAWQLLLRWRHPELPRRPA